MRSMNSFSGRAQNQPLFILRDADMQSTSDQQFVKNGTFTKYTISKIVAIRKTGGTSVACAGGIYSAASGGGDALVAVGQSWVALTGANKVVSATVAAVANTDAHNTTPYLKLATGSTAAATADLFIYGEVID